MARVLPTVMERREVIMKHVNLDTADESVRQFVLALSAEPGGSVLELEGRALVWVVPAGPASDGDETWTEEKNQRRCDLIDRKYAGRLTVDETVELARL